MARPGVGVAVRFRRTRTRRLVLGWRPILQTAPNGKAVGSDRGAGRPGDVIERAL